MPYCDNDGSITTWAWDKPTKRQATRFRMPGRDVGVEADVLGLQGQWNNCRLTAALDSQWLDITLRLYARVGSTRILVDERTPRQATHQLVPPVTSPTNQMLYGSILQNSGFPCDGFEVKAVDLVRSQILRVRAEFTMFCWGTDAWMPRQETELVPDNNAGAAIVGSALYNGFPNHTKQITFHSQTGVGGATVFLMFFDSITPPVALSVPPITPIRLLGDQQGSFAVADLGHHFRRGLTVAVSTTDRQFTASVTPDVLATSWSRIP